MITIQLENIGAIVKSFTCDELGANRGLYKQLGITVKKPYVMSQTNPKRKMSVVFDFIPLHKNFFFALMDHAAMLPSG